MNDFWKAKEIADRYEFVEELGKGGIGTVILARDRTLDKLVAIKVLNANLTNEESIRFQQEGILSGRLKHENIVSVLDFGITETNVPYLVMERLDGVSLSKAITEDGAFDVLFAVQIFQQICRGMISSHNNGVLHRDLKPANVIMVPNEDESFSAKIVDFGLARLADQDARLTTVGTAIGSPLYMSPEQGQGQAGDERSDIYSMGCLMYEALTASTPFQGDTAVLTIMMHQSAVPDRLSVRTQENFPKLLEEIVARCLGKSPKDRYQSFASLLSDLEKLEAEIVFLERQAILESRGRSGIQRALSSVTEFVPISSRPYDSKNAIRHLSVAAGLVIVGFVMFVLSLQTKNTAQEQQPVSPLAFTDSIDKSKSLMSVVERDGLLYCRGQESLKDSNLKALFSRKSIEVLDLSGTECNGTGLSFLGGSRIVKLNMDRTLANAKGLVMVAKIKGLRDLSISGCDDLTDESLSHLSKIKTLEVINYGGERFTENSFKYLKSFPLLNSVVIDEFHVTETGIDELLSIPKLHSIAFEECKLDDKVVSRLQTSTRPFEEIGLGKTELTYRLFSELRKIKTRRIALFRNTRTTAPVFMSILKDSRYFWSDLWVDGRRTMDRRPGSALGTKTSK